MLWDDRGRTRGGDFSFCLPLCVFSSYLTAVLFNSPKRKNKKTASGLMGDQIAFTFLPALLCAISVTLTCHFKLTLLLLCHVIIYLPRGGGGGGENKTQKKKTTLPV